jgi:hypothetical protein
MKKQVLVAIFLSFFSIHSFASEPDSLKRKSGVIFKLGGFANGDNVHTGFNSFALNPQFEIAFGDKISVNLGVSTEERLTSYSNDLVFSADLRYYFKSLYTLKTSRTFSGTYLAPTFYMFGAEGAANELPFSDKDFPDVNRSYVLEYGAGIKIGQQYQGLIDFGMFAGIEKAREYLSSNYNNGRYFKSSIYPMVSSYSKLAIPVGNKEFNTLLKANLDQKNHKGQLIKFGINDVFSFSKKGVFIHPKVAYEKALSNSGFAINVAGEGLIYRAKYFDADRVEGTGSFTYSEKPYLRQYLEFVFKPQVRYYFDYKKTKQNGSNLEGFYIHTTAQLRSGTEEVKRNIWYYDKFSEASFGGGLGTQHLLMGDILLDIHADLFRNKNKTFFGGGIDFSWVR